MQLLTAGTVKIRGWLLLIILPFLVLFMHYALIQGHPEDTKFQIGSSSNTSFLWGPYRPNLYFGLRPRKPDALLIGLMWYSADDLDKAPKTLRHACEQNDGMAGYGWTTYDIRDGGIHIVNDTRNKVDLVVQYAKSLANNPVESWGLDIQTIPRLDAPDHQKTSVVFYIASEERDSQINCRRNHKRQSGNEKLVCLGSLKDLGDFQVRFLDHGTNSKSGSKTYVKSMTVPRSGLWKAKRMFESEITDWKKMDDLSSPGEGMVISNPIWKPALANSPGEGNLHFVQKVLQGQDAFIVLFSPNSSQAMTPDVLRTGIYDATSLFNQRFDLVYPPQPPFREEKFVRFSKSLLSNLMGGIGFFHGTSKVDSAMKGPYSLFTAVPSRPFFPRGFLWDEGFHLQVILQWDMDLALEILCSWFNLMDEDGWIAREQILGDEARRKVPKEFQTQYPDYANPPTLFIAMQGFVARLNDTSTYKGVSSHYLSDVSAGRAFLESIYPKMKKHYDWFRRTQSGNLTAYQSPSSDFKHGYRWRGRTPQHILTSGLDDYPRAALPHPEELHIDALSWVGLMAKVLKNISRFLGATDDEMVYSKHISEIVRSIDGIHWSDSNRAYCDTTIGESSRVVKVCHKGYISLMPFVVGLMEPNHVHFNDILDLIRNPEELWSSFGLCSLSKQDELNGTGENYWRSPIWININFMVLQRLLELAQKSGSHQQRSREIYVELRKNIISTVYNSWDETGFAWEQYNPDTGKGQRTQHFTGWTSLVVNILAMPDLEEPSTPQIPRMEHRTTGKPSWNKVLSLTTLAMLLVALAFRKRLIRTWRRLVKT